MAMVQTDANPKIGGKMLYLKWTNKDIAELEMFDEIVILYTAIDKEGNVHKEIGLDSEGKVVHKAPSNIGRFGKYGIFDNQKVILTDNIESITKETFESLWEV